MSNHSQQPTDRRAREKREQRRLFWIVAVFLVVGGSAAIWLVYGAEALPLGLTCLLAGAALLGLLWLVLSLLERWLGNR